MLNLHLAVDNISAFASSEATTVELNQWTVTDFEFDDNVDTP